MQLNEQMPIRIEKNIPITPRGRSPGRKPMFPLHKMEVGDSFVLRRVRSLNTLYGAAQRIRRETGREFTVRKTEQGYRCWRVS